ncbi:hypothetical protein RRF57_011312 [Xylaria bambusicola]|uniref:Uncharacterized protein n=1 Tax=Xylaria bambusicola TaxID=326684 RepID=A0AAN7Z3J2_9PEZI
MLTASAAKNAAARPPEPPSSQSVMMSRGFQRDSPVKTLAADVVTMPITPQMVKRMGMAGSCMNWPFGDRAYRVKSGMLTLSVDHVPVILDMLESQR